MLHTTLVELGIQTSCTATEGHCGLFTVPFLVILSIHFGVFFLTTQCLSDADGNVSFPRGNASEYCFIDFFPHPMWITLHTSLLIFFLPCLLPVAQCHEVIPQFFQEGLVFEAL